MEYPLLEYRYGLRIWEKGRFIDIVILKYCNKIINTLFSALQAILNLFFLFQSQNTCDY